MTHITRLQADNFKRLSVIDIKPGTSAGIVPIRGRNAQGKSSTLDAIMAALGGKSVMPTKPVRIGAEDGAIQLTLDDGTVILRRFTTDGGDTLTVTNGQGFKATSPQQMLDKLYASVAFDPLAFTRLDSEKQFSVLRSLVKIDVDLDALAKADKADYDDRRDLNREIKTLEAQLPTLQPQGTVPEEPVDVEALQTKLEEAAEHNGNIERRKANREAFIVSMERNRGLLADAVQERDALNARIKEFEATITDQEQQIAAAPPLPDPIDVSAVSEQLRAATAANEQHRKKMVYEGERKKLAFKLEASAALTTKLEEREKERNEAIARAEMPVPGLAFGPENSVMFNGVPIEQASSAEQLRISTAIGIASSPQLRVMLVRDGSLLDDEGQQILADMAAANDFQLWVEAVATSGEVGIVLEDGAVKSVDGAEPEAPEPIKASKRRAKKDENEAAQAAHASVFEGAPIIVGIDRGDKDQSIIAMFDGDVVKDYRILPEGATDADIIRAIEDMGGTSTTSTIEDYRKKDRTEAWIKARDWLIAQSQASPAAGEGQEGVATALVAPSDNMTLADALEHLTPLNQAAQDIVDEVREVTGIKDVIKDAIKEAKADPTPTANSLFD